jgi:hypothetical protein
MTTTAPARQGEPRHNPHPASGLDRARPVRFFSLRPGWPLTALIVGFPLWWALGLGTFIFPILALPMAVELLRRRPIKVPPGFGVWLLFLLWVFASLVMLKANPPGTRSGSSQIISESLRIVEYLTATIVLLYAGNLTEKEMPQRRLTSLLSYLFLVTVGGGLLGLVAPRFQFTAPLELLLPHSMRTNLFVKSLVHPTAAQVQVVLGYSAPRPSAPFGYTNTWGNCLSILLVWIIVGWVIRGSSRQRIIGLIAVAISVVPIVFSLNRGLWVALGVCAIYVAVRLATRGKVVAVGVLAVVLVGGAVAFVVSPLHDVVTSRFQHGQSNSIRSYTVTQAITGATHSPILGYGSTRNTLGSAQSISVGKSATCQLCGNSTIGSNGQFWLVLISQGYVGAILYVWFFIAAAWRYRRDKSAIGMGGVLVLLQSFVYMLVYNALIVPLVLYMLSVALMWRNDMQSTSGSTTSPALSRRHSAPFTPQRATGLHR